MPDPQVCRFSGIVHLFRAAVILNECLDFDLWILFRLAAKYFLFQVILFEPQEIALFLTEASSSPKDPESQVDSLMQFLLFSE